MIFRKRRAAREFYFDFYEGGEVSTVQEHYIYEGPLYEKYLSSGDETLRSFKPRLSNDFKLEIMISEMLSLINAKMRRKLEQCFVVTQFNDELQASVRKHRQELDGEIIFFADGLSTAIFLYSVLLAWFIFHATEFKGQGKGARSALRSGDPQLSEPAVKEKLDRYAKTLGELQARWSKSGRFSLDESDLDSQVEMFWEAPQPVAGLAVNFATFAHKFIVGHEYAHYLLGHLDNQDNYFDLSMVFVDQWFTAPSPSIFHEFEADLISLALNSGAFSKEQRLARLQITPEAASGMTLALTVLGQIADPQQESATHPAIIDRLAQCITLVNTFAGPDDKAVVDMFKSFQSFLFDIQGKGVWGALHSYQYPSITQESYGANFILSTLRNKGKL